MSNISISAKFKSDAHIQNRRVQESRHAVIVNGIKGNQNSYLRATWEGKTDKAIEKNIVKNRIESMKKRKAADLAKRRILLAELLAAEDKMYEQEFMNNLETPEQVRAKMKERLDQLKGQREQERHQVV